MAIPGRCHPTIQSSLLSSSPHPPSTMAYSWKIPSSHTIFSSSPIHCGSFHLVTPSTLPAYPLALAPSWKIPSPHTILLSCPPHPCHSFLEDKIYPHHPSFLSPPIHVAHSWELPLPHTIQPSYCPPPLWFILRRNHPPTPSSLPLSPFIWHLPGRYHQPI